MTQPAETCPNCRQPLPPGVTACPNCRQAISPAPAQTSWLGERRQVTILFADLASYTSASEKADPEDVVDMLNTLFSRLMAECDKEGGYLDKTVGDEMMVLFGAPKAHEDDPARAVRAAMAMKAAMEELTPIVRQKVKIPGKINIGINTGSVVWGDLGPVGRTAPTVIGDTVNLAARLESYATDGQIIVSEAVYHRTRQLFDYEILEPIEVKGKSGKIPIYMPLRPLQKTETVITDPFEVKSPLIGREQELDALHAYWLRAKSGYSQILLISGEAGIGKSYLLTEFLNTVNTLKVDKKTPIILQTRRETTPGNRYRPLNDLVSQLFGLVDNDTEVIRRRKIEDRAQVLGITSSKFLPLMGYLLGWYQQDPRLENSQEQQNLSHLHVAAIDAAVDLFFKQSVRRPTLLIIDDLDRADAKVVEWLNRLIIASQMLQAEPTQYQLMIVAAMRPRTDSPVGTLQTQNVITLSPLDEAMRKYLLANLLPGQGLPMSLITRLCKESEGNPFYLVEVARGLVQSGQLVKHGDTWRLTRPVDQLDVPHSVEGLVLSKLDTLDPDARRTLQHASVIGHNFTYKLLAAITPIANLDQALNSLKERGFITEKELSVTQDRTFTFTQVVLREVTYNSILRKTRRELHKLISEMAEDEEASKGVNMGSLVYQYASGGEQEKMIAFNWLTGKHALDRFQPEEAYHYLEQAWNTLVEIRNPDPEVYINLAEALGDAGTFTGHFAQATTCYQTAWSLAGANAERKAALYYKMGRLHFYQGDVPAAAEDYQNALRLGGHNVELCAQIKAEIRLLFDMG